MSRAVSVNRDAESLRLGAACQSLVGAYPVQNWWPSRSRFEVMAGAVLVQNTRWTGVAAVLRALRRERALNPRAIAAMPTGRLVRLIRPAGCQSIKAGRLQSLANWIVRCGGLRRIGKQDTLSLREALLGVHGIGPETADAILCFGFDREVFIADQYARRWLNRMELTFSPHMKSYERCRRDVEVCLDGASLSFSELHAAIVMHGQSVCAAEPACARCPVYAQCAFPANAA